MMHLSRVRFKVVGGRTHDVIILFVNYFVNSFGARTVAKCSQLDDIVNSFGLGLLRGMILLICSCSRLCRA